MRKNPTDAERALWRVLRAKRLSGWKFRRQQRIDPYIADFVCFESRLIVEADGSQHIDSPRDERRDAFLKAQGFVVLRFFNNDILAQPDAVLASVLASLEASDAASSRNARCPSPRPSPARGEGEEKDVPSA